ncbi:1076_t:CDS:2 [Ambispora leptoticha]|uniref:1076_t:CDS:1 n=1 Tax=Ambispora leptoticha TaxID=144679 RepID=A0A9N9EYZ7_9GLOM|nr:1076_t:CDS:2 [Ambispora leptoticha]
MSTSEPSLDVGEEIEDSDHEEVSAAFPFTEMRTVFSDPVNYNVKHPLFNAWTLWFDNPGKKASQNTWSQNLKEMITFDSVEEFWGVYNNIVKSSDLASGSNYHLFKQGIKPMWEDPINEKGGKWVIQFHRSRIGEEINNLWLYTMLACIGESFDFPDEICGAVVSVRKIFYRISLWTRTSNNIEMTKTLGRQLKSTLGLPANQTLEFQAHSDSIKSGNPNKDRLLV